MTSSRIFIKNLPASLTIEDFRKHFSQQAPITDAKFLPHRRIGYVGYKTAEDASRAVKHHNKAFVGMTRLKVELARSVDDVSGRDRKRQMVEGKESAIERSNKKQERIHESYHQEHKRKPESTSKDSNAKLQEYLQVMQPPSKSKTWENQDAVTLYKEAQDKPQNEALITSVAMSDDEYEHVPKKRKVLKKENAPTESKLPSPPDTPAAVVHYDENADQEPVTVLEEATETPPAASDADWLRSRTSRLLGLVEDNEGIEGRPLLGERPTKQATPETKTLRQENEGDIDTTTKTDEDAHKGDDTTGARLTESESISTGRLFVRNLTYSTTEEDLRNHFASHGYREIEEVGFCLSSCGIPLVV